MNTPKRFMRISEVVATVGLKRTTIYKKLKTGTFPPPVQLGLRAVAWAEADIADWQAALKSGVKSSSRKPTHAPADEVSSCNAAVYSRDDLARLEVAIDSLTKEVSKLRRQIEALQKDTKNNEDGKNAD